MNLDTIKNITISFTNLVSQHSVWHFVLRVLQGSFDFVFFKNKGFIQQIKGFNFLIEQLFPVYSIKKDVLFQFLIPITHTMLGTSAQQFFYKYFAVFLAISGILDARVDDFFVNGKRIIRIFTKGQLPTQKFVHNDTQRPQIHMEAVSLTCNDLGRHVMGRSNDCGGPKPSLDF